MNRAKHRRPAPHRVRNTAVVCGVSGVAVIASTGTAAAYWSGKGAGTGTAGLSNAPAIVTADATPTAALYPNGPAGALYLRINASSRPVKVTGLRQDTGRPVTVSGAPGTCSGTVITVATVGNLAITVSASAVNATVPSVVSIATNAPGSCQGATFTIPVILTGQAL